MPGIFAVREAEAWTATNIIGGIVLLAAALALLIWAIRRYLED